MSRVPGPCAESFSSSLLTVHPCNLFQFLIHFLPLASYDLFLDQGCLPPEQLTVTVSSYICCRTENLLSVGFFFFPHVNSQPHQMSIISIFSPNQANCFKPHTGRAYSVPRPQEWIWWTCSSVSNPYTDIRSIVFWVVFFFNSHFASQSRTFFSLARTLTWKVSWESVMIPLYLFFSHSCHRFSRSSYHIICTTA